MEEEERDLTIEAAEALESLFEGACGWLLGLGKKTQQEEGEEAEAEEEV
jgi:hypothetical protein